MTMYQRARKLASLSSSNPEQFLSLGELQLEAYIISINALSLVDPKSAWIVLPYTADVSNEVWACYISIHFLLLIGLSATLQKTTQSLETHTRRPVHSRKT